MLSHEIIDITVQESIIPDCKYALQDLRANDLRIEDLGYFKVEKFRVIEKAQAYFLSRLKFGVNIYILEKEQLTDIRFFSNKLKSNDINEIANSFIYLSLSAV